MRLLLVFLLCASAAVAADAPDALETARQLAASGAPRLALSHIEQAQPRDPSAPRWAEWEVLRLSLLARLNRQQDLLARAGMLPTTMPAAQLREALILAARAASAAAQGAAARHYAARLLWQLSPSASEAREIRLLVIESYVTDGKGEDAFRSMLRFDQDYRPLDRQTATRFVETLLDLGMAKEAINWLAALDDAGPVKLLLRLKAGLTTAEAATAQARAFLARNSDAGYWRVLAQAAQQQGGRVVHIEALENILHLEETKNPPQLTVQARALWQAYLTATQEIANQNQLLTGDDDGWTEFAARRLGSHPVVSRAIFAHLAQRGRTGETRHNAQLQLVYSLQSGRLELTALRLFNDGGADVTTLDLQARFLLGVIAEGRNLPVIALHFWQGLSTPPSTGAEEWQLRVAGVALRAGKADAAAAALQQALAGNKTPAPEVVRRSVLLVQEMLDAGKPDLADALFVALLPLADGGERRQILFSLGRINEITGRSPVAAGYYLRSALLAEGKAPDALALQARIAAALNLARAGYRDDARAQFEWLLRNSRDPAQLEIARRELKKL